MTTTRSSRTRRVSCGQIVRLAASSSKWISIWRLGSSTCWEIKPAPTRTPRTKTPQILRLLMNWRRIRKRLTHSREERSKWRSRWMIRRSRILLSYLKRRGSWGGKSSTSKQKIGALQILCRCQTTDLSECQKLLLLRALSARQGFSSAPWPRIGRQSSRSSMCFWNNLIREACQKRDGST